MALDLIEELTARFCLAKAFLTLLWVHKVITYPAIRTALLGSILALCKVESTGLLVDVSKRAVKVAPGDPDVSVCGVVIKRDPILCFLLQAINKRLAVLFDCGHGARCARIVGCRGQRRCLQ